eukprot:1158868-Pelagomonas_calceolata.AAC.7
MDEPEMPSEPVSPLCIHNAAVLQVCPQEAKADDEDQEIRIGTLRQFLHHHCCLSLFLWQPISRSTRLQAFFCTSFE